MSETVQTPQPLVLELPFELDNVFYFTDNGVNDLYVEMELVVRDGAFLDDAQVAQVDETLTWHLNKFFGVDTSRVHFVLVLQVERVHPPGLCADPARVSRRPGHRRQDVHVAVRKDVEVQLDRRFLFDRCAVLGRQVRPHGDAHVVAARVLRQLVHVPLRRAAHQQGLLCVLHGVVYDVQSCVTTQQRRMCSVTTVITNACVQALM